MRVKLLIGEICAGKTTYSKNLVKKNNYLRLSMDDLKIMMFNKITSDKFSDDIIESMIEHVISLIDSNHQKDIIIDGFPLNMEAIRYLISCYTVEIIIFEIDLFKANLRNRQRNVNSGIYIAPEEIKQYSKAFKKFINSDEFYDVTKTIKVTYLENYEKKNLEM